MYIKYIPFLWIMKNPVLQVSIISYKMNRVYNIANKLQNC